MTETAPTRRRSILPVAIAAVFVIGIVAVVVAITVSGADETAFIELYRAESTRLDRHWERPAEPPEWTLEEGSAADDYREAWTLAENGRPPSADPAANAFNAIAPDHRGPRPAAPSATGEPPAKCKAIGVRYEADPALSLLDEESCEAIAGEALDLVRQGTHRKISSSPARVWDAWQIKKPGDSPNFVPFIRLARLHLLRGWIKHVNGDTDALIDAIHEVHRFGQDVGRGSTLLGGMVATAIDHFATRMLQRVLTDGLLTGAQAERLHRQLVWADQESLVPRDVFAGEFVVMSPALLAPEDLKDLPVPPTALNDPGFVSPGVLAWYWRQGFVELHGQYWRDLLTTEGRTFPERNERYLHWEEEFSKSINPLVQISGTFIAQYDLKLVMQQSHLRLLEIALADLAYQGQHGRPASSLDELASAGLTVPVDPLLLEPFELTEVEGRRVVRSRCPEIPRLSAWQDDQPLLTVDLPTLRAAPTTPPPPPDPAPESPSPPEDSPNPAEN